MDGLRCTEACRILGSVQLKERTRATVVSASFRRNLVGEGHMALWRGRIAFRRCPKWTRVEDSMANSDPKIVDANWAANC